MTPSFPTRRSSDLVLVTALLKLAHGVERLRIEGPTGLGIEKALEEEPMAQDAPRLVPTPGPRQETVDRQGLCFGHRSRRGGWLLGLALEVASQLIGYNITFNHASVAGQACQNPSSTVYGQRVSVRVVDEGR